MLIGREDRFNGYHNILRNLYHRTRDEFQRSPSIRHIGGQIWADQVHFSVFSPRKKYLELFSIHYVIATLKQNCMRNFDQIDEMNGRQKFESYRLLHLSIQS